MWRTLGAANVVQTQQMAPTEIPDQYHEPTPVITSQCRANTKARLNHNFTDGNFSASSLLHTTKDDEKNATSLCSWLTWHHDDQPWMPTDHGLYPPAIIGPKSENTTGVV